jgi:hypothetical protein
MERDELQVPALDAAEPDPRPRWKRAASQIVAVRLRELPEDARVRILRILVPILDKDLAAAFEAADYGAADAALLRFDERLLKDAVSEFERMRAAVGDGVEALLGELNARAWNGLEIEGVRALLALLKGERLVRVDWRHVETSTGRRITREAARSATEPSTYSRGRWTESHSFISERALRELEEQAAERQRGETPPGSDSRNTDFSRGIRP